MKFLCVGDLHIGRLETLFKKWEDWTLAPLHQAVNYAHTNNISHIIQVGDVYDSPNPSQHLLLLLMTFLREIEIKFPKIQFHFILGNHDIQDINTNSLILLKYVIDQYSIKNVNIYTKPTKKVIDNVPFVFLPWPIYKHKYLNESVISIAHIERKGAKYDSGKIVDKNKFPLGSSFWVIGHLHEPQVNRQLIFVGAPLQLRHGDNPDKYLWRLDAKLKHNKVDCKYKKIAVNKPYTLTTIKVTNLADAEWQRQFQQLNDTTFVRLRVGSNIVLPDKYLRHKQVLHVELVGKKVDLELNKAKTIKVENFGSTKARLKAVKMYLIKSGIRKARIKRALRIAHEMEQQIMKR